MEAGEVGLRLRSGALEGGMRDSGVTRVGLIELEISVPILEKKWLKEFAIPRGSEITFPSTFIFSIFL